MEIVILISIICFILWVLIYLYLEYKNSIDKSFNELALDYENKCKENNMLYIKLYTKSIAFIKPTHYVTLGEYNGYVAIPPSNKYYKYCYTDYEDIPIKVHGGVTFGQLNTDELKDWLSDIEIITPNITEIPKGWYIIGFDTLHYGDTPINWNKENVIKETLQLEKQLTN